MKWPRSISKVKKTGRAGCWWTWESQLGVHVCLCAWQSVPATGMRLWTQGFIRLTTSKWGDCGPEAVPGQSERSQLPQSSTLHIYIYKYIHIFSLLNLHSGQSEKGAGWGCWCSPCSCECWVCLWSVCWQCVYVYVWCVCLLCVHMPRRNALTTLIWVGGEDMKMQCLCLHQATASDPGHQKSSIHKAKSVLLLLVYVCVLVYCVDQKQIDLYCIKVSKCMSTLQFFFPAWLHLAHLFFTHSLL